MNLLKVCHGKKPLEFPHFPTRHQAVVWRNWGTVPVENIARAVGAGNEDVLRTGAEMGLRNNPGVTELWLERGYNTIIRDNWHLLPYDQLLTLLGWTPEKLAIILKEDDFLWLKLGAMKPEVEPVVFRALTKEERVRTEEIYMQIEKHFPGRDDEMREKPFDFLKTFSMPHEEEIKTTNVSDKLNLVYSYSALYGDPLFDPALNPYPDGLLESLAKKGVNGIWLQGILYHLHPWRLGPELCAGYEKRVDNLNKLIQRAAKFGMGVYLYINEPRGPSLSFYERHPELRKDFLGIEYPERDGTTMCTSKVTVRDYLENGMTWLFKNTPGLAGVFTITMSENPTNCYSKVPPVQGRLITECPLCKERHPEEVIVEVNRIIAKAAGNVDSRIRVIAWDWAWTREWIHKAINLLPEDITLMCTSEAEMAVEIGGVKGKVGDYTISQPGPGERSIAAWEHARKRGIKVMAKIQISTSWECAPVPYIPVPTLVEKHLNNLKKLGVDEFMLTWTMGGYPSINMDILMKSYDEMLSENFGAAKNGWIDKALRKFGEAFQEYPFGHGVVYFAPHNPGPMNLLFESSSGYFATMVGFPYDNLERWRNHYPEDVFESQFEKLSLKWKEGLEILNLASVEIPHYRKNNFDDLDRVARAVYCHFRSAYLQIAFVRLREKKEADSGRRILNILREEIQLAKSLCDIMKIDSRIGFEASNHYAYTVENLMEKVLNCEYLLSRFAL